VRRLVQREWGIGRDDQRRLHVRQLHGFDQGRRREPAANGPTVRASAAGLFGTGSRHQSE
jgi:hypothetical protein